jgi:hypothetical protein
MEKSMSRPRTFVHTLCLCATLTIALSLPAHASLILNGGFESGLAGWTAADRIGSDGTFFLQTGTSSPVNGFPVPPPPEGTFAAMTDSQAPGSHILYQDFLVPTSLGGGTIGFSLFINNMADNFYTPSHLDFSTPDLNQQARVDVMTTSADPFSLDVLQNLYQTLPGDPLVSGYTSFLLDISPLLLSHAGETLRLRFAEVDNVFFFNLGVDAVSIDVTAAPEPSLWMLLGAPLAGLGLRARRRR